MVEPTERDRQLGCLIEPGMTEAQVSAEREICELIQRVRELQEKDFPDSTIQPLLERIEQAKKVRGVRQISGFGSIEIPIEMIQNAMGFPWAQGDS